MELYETALATRQPVEGVLKVPKPVPKPSPPSGIKNPNGRCCEYCVWCQFKPGKLPEGHPGAEGQQLIDKWMAGPKATTNKEFHFFTARYIVECCLPFRHVECRGYRRYVVRLYGQDFMTRHKLTFPSAKVIATRIEQLYERDKLRVKKMLDEAYYVCTTSDIWTGYRRGYLGITAHWMDPTTLVRQTATLAFRYLPIL